MIEEAARLHGWPAMATMLRAAALGAYARGNLPAAEAWRNAARWAAAWAEPAGEYAARWRQAMRKAGWQVGEDARAPESSGQLMADSMESALRLWVLGTPAFSAEYFSLEGTLDFRPEVFRILAELRAADPEGFAAYTSLAVAIALVYDTPPPQGWPHGQVKPDPMFGRLPAARDAFAYFVELDRSGKSLQPLAKLEAAELRFLVDMTLTAEERKWVQTHSKVTLGRLDETYTEVRYRRERIEAKIYVWPGARYSLEDIFREGGICVDQAYYATQTGKARGVPTLLFSGAGLDGRHAWFGYLGSGRKWRMDAGRYEEQKLVSGRAIDPQSWAEVTDHELAFLSEGFRREKNAREALIHAGFARWRMEEGDRAGAAEAARKALRFERRTLEGWNVLLALRAGAGVAREAIAYEAAAGFSDYPELQAHYLAIAAESLRARGETSRAEFVEREQARKFKEDRGDLSVVQLAGQLSRARATMGVAEQIRLYGDLLRQFGKGAGAGMWDEVVRPFVVYLAEQGQIKEARAALRRAREAMEVTVNSQVAREMAVLDDELARRKREP